MKLVIRIATIWGLSALLASPLVGPLTGPASAAWEAPSDVEPTDFWGGGNDPNDQTTDPDEPFDGLDRIVSPDKVVVSADARPLSFVERLVRFVQSLRVLKG